MFNFSINDQDEGFHITLINLAVNEIVEIKNANSHVRIPITSLYISNRYKWNLQKSSIRQSSGI